MGQRLDKMESKVDGTMERVEKFEAFVHRLKENNTNMDKLIKEQVETCVREMKPNMEQSSRNNVDKKMLPLPAVIGNLDGCSSSGLVEGETLHIEWPQSYSRNVLCRISGPIHPRLGCDIAEDCCFET